MLTESEREWLENRAKRTDDKFCRWCPYNHSRGREEEDGLYCYCYVDWESEYRECLTDLSYINRIYEAVAFEQRVAAKLADSISNELNFVSGKNVVQEAVEYRGKRHTIAWARLKLARLRVEEEMDGQGQD